MPGPRIGVIVPCHNEADVIERKLENLAGLDWPEADGPHRIVVVDDGSTDETAAFARACCARLFGGDLQATVVANGCSAGKPGAIEQALAVLAGDTELLCLTDADVIFEPAVPRLVAAAFTPDSTPAMATGEQLFVRSLADDGTCTSDHGGPLEQAGGIYDHLTARVRRFESGLGLLFSVHGQLLVWRAELGLHPTPGLAADDLDLMLQARGSSGGRGRIVQVPGATFLEVRAPLGPERRVQALRRARAYVQFLAHPRARELTVLGGTLRRAQGAFYRVVPTATPWIALVVVAASVAIAAWVSGPVLAGQLTIGWGIVAITPPGRRCTMLLRTIRSAVRSQAAGDLGDRWETARR